MSKATIDHRTQISELADIALEARAAALGIDKAAVSRMVIQEFAEKAHREHRIFARRLAAHGMQLAFDGLDLADDGIARSQPERGGKR